NTITEAARKTLGEARKQANKWYNNECQNAVLKRNDYPESKELFETERCKQVIQREKRKYMNEIIYKTEQDYTQEKVRNFFTAIKRHQ
ncbi:hypothetical protein ACI65C_006929, partial [Semiaphis heraclei]